MKLEKKKILKIIYIDLPRAISEDKGVVLIFII